MEINLQNNLEIHIVYLRLDFRTKHLILPNLQQVNQNIFQKTNLHNDD